MQMPAPSPAMRFLTALDENAAEFCFRTFADATASSGVRPRNYTGSLDEHRTALARANATGAGVFVVVNHGGHAAAAIDRIRAVFVDLDGAELEPVLQCALEPHMVIESSPGRYHAYWFCDGVPVEKFRAVQQAIAARFGGDPAVCDPSRVMRVPGTTWHKGLKPHVVTIIKENCGQRYSANRYRRVPPDATDSKAYASTAYRRGHHSRESTSCVDQYRCQTSEYRSRFRSH